jgi:hypothetical protein
MWESDTGRASGVRTACSNGLLLYTVSGARKFGHDRSTDYTCGSY